MISRILFIPGMSASNVLYQPAHSLGVPVTTLTYTLNNDGTDQGQIDFAIQQVKRKLEAAVVSSDCLIIAKSLGVVLLSEYLAQSGKDLVASTALLGVPSKSLVLGSRKQMHVAIFQGERDKFISPRQLKKYYKYADVFAKKGYDHSFVDENNGNHFDEVFIEAARLFL